MALIVVTSSGYCEIGATQTVSDARAVPAADDAIVAEVVVTAQKRVERLQDVPMSITAATAEQLQAMGVVSPDQLQKVVPGFSVEKTVYGTPVFFIRGIGFNDTTLGVSPAVTVYMDQMPLPFTPMSRGSVLDLERVEVLKGPQGTLFGQNSTGGAINFITAKPTDVFESGVELSYGRFNQTQTEAFVSGPISSTVSARVALRGEYQDDWQKGHTTDQTIGKKRFYNSRVLVDWTPSDAVKVELMASGWRDRSDSQQPQNIVSTPLKTGPGAREVPYPVASFPAAPDDPRAAAWNDAFDLQQDNQFYQFSARADIQTSDRTTLTSLTSYQRYEQSVPLSLSGTTYPVAKSIHTGTIPSFSQELRLDGAMSERWRWMLGGNYQKDTVDERLIFNPLITSGTLVGPFNFDSFYVDNEQQIESRSAFGSLDLQLTERLSAQTSLRYTKQDRDFAGCVRDDGNGQTAAALGFLSTLLTGTAQAIAPGSCSTLSATGVPLPIVTGDLNEDNVSWRESLNWKPSEDTLLYANVTKGYKAGSFATLPASVASQYVPVSQESVLAYEVGFKGVTASRRLQVDGAVFYYDYKDKQLVGYLVVPPFGPLPSLVSIPTSTVRGGELNAIWQPFEQLTLSANATYIDTQVDDNPVNPTGPFGNPADFTGQSFPHTPEWQSVVSGLYRAPLASSLIGYIGATVSNRSSTSASLLSGSAAVASQEALLEIDSYTLLDLRAGIEAEDGRWRVEIWGRNVTNEFHEIGATRNSDYMTRFAGLPAMYGVTFGYRIQH